MTLGMNYPHGPLAWAHAIGVEHVTTTLDALWQEYREERYRMAPTLRRWRAPNPYLLSVVVQFDVPFQA